jgi:hypothetical protein
MTAGTVSLGALVMAPAKPMATWGHRIDNAQQALAMSYPIFQEDLKRKWASIGIEQILRGAAATGEGSVDDPRWEYCRGLCCRRCDRCFGLWRRRGARRRGRAGIGLEVGNLILLALGLSAIAEYFIKGLPVCLATLQEGIATAWNAEEGVKPGWTLLEGRWPLSRSEPNAPRGNWPAGKNSWCCCY